MRYLCERIWEVEWSGILFYSTENQFGDDNFSIQLQHILLMDKGSSTYTEFDTSSDYVEFLMDNPEMLQYRRALVHSHNNMGK